MSWFSLRCGYEFCAWVCLCECVLCLCNTFYVCLLLTPTRSISRRSISVSGLVTNERVNERICIHYNGSEVKRLWNHKQHQKLRRETYKFPTQCECSWMCACAWVFPLSNILNRDDCCKKWHRKTLSAHKQEPIIPFHRLSWIDANHFRTSITFIYYITFIMMSLYLIRWHNINTHTTSPQ